MKEVKVISFEVDDPHLLGLFYADILNEEYDSKGSLLGSTIFEVLVLIKMRFYGIIGEKDGEALRSRLIVYRFSVIGID